MKETTELKPTDGDGMDRRELLRMGAGALGVAAGALLIGCGGSAGLSTNGTTTTTGTATGTATGSTGGINGGTAGPYVDTDFLNFILNFEFLKAQYYSWGATGAGLTTTLLGSKPGTVIGGAQVPNLSATVLGLARDFASDDILHIQTLQSLISTDGSAGVSMPTINFTSGFNTLGQLANIGSPFNAFATEENFLLGAFFFEDPVVTAQFGCLQQLTNGNNLVELAGIMGTDSYHAGAVRDRIFTYSADALGKANNISGFRGSISGGEDSPILSTTLPIIAPVDTAGLIFARTTRQIEDIFYMSSTVGAGGFFPFAVNGNIAKFLQPQRRPRA